MESTLTMPIKIVDVRKLHVPEIEVDDWLEDFDDHGNKIHRYENTEEHIYIGDNLIVCHLTVESKNYGKKTANVYALKLYGLEEEIKISDAEKEILRNKIIKTFK
ncbi:hypothetical protein [Flagellimonas flava]|uniref:hypothetical protein n=1 Tax=Flagellimonas flava TaxID=570519 RepID=UPI003D65D426